MKNLKTENEKLRQQIDELRNLKAATVDTTSNQIQTTQHKEIRAIQLQVI